MYLKSHAGLKEVYFDDFKVDHIKSPIIATQDYYPFGLTFNSYQRENSVPNKFLFQGKELQNDLGLDVYDFEWRQFDPTIGRTTTLDPHADSYWDLSPYSFLGNNPINVLDPTGMDTVKVKDLDMSKYNPEEDVVDLDEVVITPGDDEEEEESAEETSSSTTTEGSDTETPERGFGGPKDAYDVRGIASIEPYEGFWGGLEYFWDGGYGGEGGVHYNRDGTPRMKGVAFGYPPEFLGGSGTLGMAKKIASSKNAVSPQTLKAAKSYYRLTLEHMKKLRLYAKNPKAFDNAGHLAKNAGNPQIQQKIINSRIDHLSTEIKTFYNNFWKLFE